jgi:predicted molibdopterin-dependent oxidoreductase YjgC
VTSSMLRRANVPAYSSVGFSDPVGAVPAREPDGCRLEVDGLPFEAPTGQSLAAALVHHGLWIFRRNPVTGEARGPYCGMGVCFECELEVDGRKGTRACLTEVADGMVVRTAAVPTREQ